MKKINAITLLETQHEEIVTLLEELTVTTDRGIKIRGRLLNEIADKLEAHMRIEEEIFYPAYREAVTTTVRMWVLGRIVSAALIGIGVSVGLWLLDIPLALMLGLLAGVLTFVPNFGPIASAIPAMLLALTRSPLDVLYVMLLFIGVQIVESTVLTPMIEKRAVEVPPALLLGVQVILGLLTGIVGLALAAPLTAVAMVLIRHLYVEDVLGDDMAKPIDWPSGHESEAQQKTRQAGVGGAAPRFLP